MVYKLIAQHEASEYQQFVEYDTNWVDSFLDGLQLTLNSIIYRLGSKLCVIRLTTEFYFNESEYLKRFNQNLPHSEDRKVSLNNISDKYRSLFLKSSFDN